MAYHGVSSFGSNDSGYESAAMEMFDEAPRVGLNSKEFAKNLARQRQNMLAEELSRLDAEEYQHDILDHMLHVDVSMPFLAYFWTLADRRLGRYSSRC